MYYFCSLEENEKQKCAQYWPGETDLERVFQSATRRVKVTKLNEKTTGAVTCRTLSILPSDEAEVRHFSVSSRRFLGPFLKFTFPLLADHHYPVSLYPMAWSRRAWHGNLLWADQLAFGVSTRPHCWEGGWPTDNSLQVSKVDSFFPQAYCRLVKNLVGQVKLDD